MAFTPDGSVRIKIFGDISDFNKSMTAVTNSISKFGKTLMNLGAAVGLAFGVGALVNFGKESIKLASDIQEFQNVIDVTFGQGARQIEEFAQSAAAAFGLSELSAKQYTGTMGAMLKSSGLATAQAQEMSTTLAGLAGDMASFYNLDTDTAFEKIRAGISGETEPLKQLGINMSVANLEAYALSQGITKVYNAMSPAEQVLLRYNYLLSVTTDAQGDFARTSGSFANQVRLLQLNFDQLRIAVGNALIPIAQAVLPSINAIIEDLTKLAQVFAQVTALLFGKSAEVKAVSGIASSAGAAADATDKLADSTAGAGSAAKKAAKDMKGVLAGFDELNILADNAADSVGGAAGGLGGIGGIDGAGLSGGEIWGDATINPQITEEVYALMKKLEEMIPLVAGIGSGFLAWKLASALIPDLGAVQGLLGSLMVGVGVTLLVDSIQDIVFGDGLTWENILKGGAGGALAGGGIGFMLAKKLGLTWLKGMLGGAVIGLGIALLIESISDIIVRGLNVGNGLLGIIGGAIAGAAVGFFTLKGATGAILGAAIGVGLALVIESITDIAVSGLNLKNGVVGLIGGALAGANIGLKLTGSPTGAVLGAVAGLFLTLALEGITSQIKNGFNILNALQTIIGTALAGAAIGSIIPGVGTGVGLVIGLVAGIVLEIVGIKAAGDAIYKTTEDFQTMTRIISECESASDRSSAALESLSQNVEGLNTSLADIGAAQDLADEIYAINDNADASAYELELMATKVGVLNSMNLGDLHLTIDETTGRIVETKEATDRLIDSLQKEAETAALQELLVEAYKSRYTAVSDAEQAVRNIEAAEQALQKTEQELTNTPWWDPDKHAALVAQQEKQTEALEAATKARDDAVTAYDELSGAIDTYSGALTGLSEPESNVGVNLEDRMTSVRNTLDSAAKDMPGYGQNISAGLEKGMRDGLTEEETKGTFNKIKDWVKDTFKIHSPSKVFEEYGGFMMAGLHNGLDENMPPITDLLSGLWEDIGTDAASKWEEIKLSLGNTWENIQGNAQEKFNNIGMEIGEAWGGIKENTSQKWEEIKNGLSEKFGNIELDSETGFANIKDTILNKIDETMTDLFGKDWKSVGKNIVDGVLDGLRGIFGRLSSWASDVWGTITSSFSSSNAKASISNSGRPARSGSPTLYRMVESPITDLPRLANGAVIPPNQQFAAILGDQRSGMNIEAPLKTIEQALRNVMGESNFGSDVVINLTAELDGKVLTKKVIRVANAMTRAAGKPVLLN